MPVVIRNAILEGAAPWPADRSDDARAILGPALFREPAFGICAVPYRSAGSTISGDLSLRSGGNQPRHGNANSLGIRA